MGKLNIHILLCNVFTYLTYLIAFYTYNYMYKFIKKGVHNENLRIHWPPPTKLALAIQ